MTGQPWENYKTAVVRFYFPSGTYQVHAAGTVGASSGPFPDEADHQTIHVITAHNPGGMDADKAYNAEAHERLVSDLTERGLTVWEAVGGDPTWGHTERSVAVVGLTDDAARELAAHYRQEAVFAWRPDAWLLLASTTPRARMTGWTCTRTDTESRSQETTSGEPSPRPSIPAAPRRRTPDPEPEPGRGPGHIATVTTRADPLPDVDGEVLAEIQWELDGGGGSPGNADSGTLYLLRADGGYYFAQVQGGECIVDPVQANDDESAIAMLARSASPDETMTVYLSDEG